ncbi:poly-beta-1,6 N-acetyl-D-glucosamine export porin PgaA [Inquilinus sp. Marseille-Q2685]|uniref:poly-beta-1,6 N-acetyl-D-glucosamine export porin PgaA n=1 Tax=Inquilinus sp. Marseille-Q2685 TaxID=2866581 RepID=UPI001CE48638|nr:poly-beta-1,6 N-acetyl-D-glucosamine export porin PgaA [Inquilinus sp. Marseille-Q2685]
MSKRPFSPHIAVPLIFAAMLAGQAGSARAEDYDSLIRAARAGQYEPALAMLRTLTHDSPGNLRAAYDRIAITGWAGRDAEVTEAYEALPRGAALPLDLQEVVAKAYRNRQRWDRALALYRDGRRRAPGQAAFRLGEVLVLADAGRAEEAIRLGQALVSGQPRDADARLALGYAYARAGHSFDSLAETDRAVALAPRREDLARERIFALERAGLPQAALRDADRRPGLLAAEDRRRLEGDAAAELVRLAPLPSRREAERFAVADRAIAMLDDQIARWRAEGDAAAKDVIRARLDRIGALQARARMQDVVDEYEALRAEGVDVPPYVLSDVASAYLYLRRPEIARDLYRQVLAAGTAEATPEDELGLFYALVESERIEEAQVWIDAVNARRPVWLQPRGQADKTPNDRRLDSEVAAANARYFADDLPEAERRFRAMTDAAPNNVQLRAGLAEIYGARGWPRRAEQELAIAQTEAPRALSVEVAQGETALLLREWRQVEVLVQDLVARFPENPDVRRLAREWEVHTMAELQIKGDRGVAGSTPVSGGDDLSVEAVLYSPPIAYNWRGFAGLGRAAGAFDDGHAEFTWGRAGLEWRSRDLIVEGEVSGNRYGHGTRVGARLAATVDIDDEWQVGATGEILSRDTPLRALEEGIGSDRVSGFIRWRQDERREIGLTVGNAWFGDGNNRTTVALDGQQRIYTAPHFKADLKLDLAASFNSEGGDTDYFNPKADLAALPQLELQHILYRRYDTVWRHSLTFGAGPYWQQDFGTGVIATVGYRQEFETDNVFQIGAGISGSYRPYDGDYETELRVNFDLTYRF